MKITWYGHSCFRVETGKSIILIDPFLKGSPTFQTSGVSFEAATKGVTHVAITHGHDDHIGDAGEVCKANGAELYATYELALHIGGKGAEKLQPMNTGGTVYGADFDLTLVDALHSYHRGASISAIPTASSFVPRRARRSTTWATPTCSRAWD